MSLLITCSGQYAVNVCFVVIETVVNGTRTKFNKGVTMRAVVMKNVGCVPKNNNMFIYQRGKFLINLAVTTKTTT